MIIINRWNQALAVAGAAVLLSAGTSNLTAQPGPGRGNFDPEQFRQRAMERYKEQLEVKSDDEWKIISERIDKVMSAQREFRLGGFGGFGGGRRGGGNPPDNAGRANRFGGEPNPDAEALQKALDAKVSSDELKTKLAKLRETQKDKEARLTKAQEELRSVLSLRQEATAVLNGLLK